MKKIIGNFLKSVAYKRHERKQKKEINMEHKYQLSHGGRETHVSVKFKKDRTNDCSVRAIAHALYSNPSKPIKSRNYLTG